MYNIFYILLLKQDTTRKKRMNEIFSESEPEFDIGDNKKYKIKVIRDIAVYTKKVERHLLGLYYLVSWKITKKKKAPETLFSSYV